jgi:hypothetical protein
MRKTDKSDNPNTDTGHGVLGRVENASLPARWPRLVDDHGAAEYLGVSRWSVRDWVAAGKLPVVTLPATRPREGERHREALRRILFDLQNLDTFVEEHKTRKR